MRPADPLVRRSVLQAGFAPKYNPVSEGPLGFCIDDIQALRRVDAGLDFTVRALFRRQDLALTVISAGIREASPWVVHCSHCWYWPPC